MPASEQDQDDSFTYGASRLKKNQAKRKKIKNKLGLTEKRGRVKKQDRKNNEFEIPDAEYVDYVYTTGNTKAKVELKVFNPQLHIENQILKKKYEQELEEVFKQFGKKYAKVEEPQMTTGWRYLLRQVE